MAISGRFGKVTGQQELVLTLMVPTVITLFHGTVLTATLLVVKAGVPVLKQEQ
jgi:hypothetical protein